MLASELSFHRSSYNSYCLTKCSTVIVAVGPGSGRRSRSCYCLRGCFVEFESEAVSSEPQMLAWTYLNSTRRQQRRSPPQGFRAATVRAFADFGLASRRLSALWVQRSRLKNAVRSVVFSRLTVKFLHEETLVGTLRQKRVACSERRAL